MSEETASASGDDQKVVWVGFERRVRQQNKREKVGGHLDRFNKRLDQDWDNLSDGCKRDVVPAITRYNDARKQVNQLDEAKSDGVTGSRGLRKRLKTQRDLRQAMEALIEVQKNHKKECHKDGRRWLETWLGECKERIGELEKQPQESESGDDDVDDNRPEASKRPEAADSKEQRRLQTGQLGVGWVLGVQSLGKGATGKASLWVKQNFRGEIIDRVVVKDSFFDTTPENRDFWNNKTSWTTSRKEESKRVPVEVYALYSLRGKKGSDYVVRIRNWRLQTEKMMHRQYLEFCPDKDLFDLVDAYHRDVWFIPEPFIWYCFECLVIAGLLMQHGEIERNPVANDEIVHRDMKLQNVFLGPPSDTQYLRYPTPKLGDFGLAVLLSEHKNGNPDAFSVKGTPHNLPPEQIDHIFDGEKRRRPLTSKTNVWGIGNTIWSLIEQEEGCIRGYSEQTRREPVFNESSRKNYSTELCDLVSQCTRYWPEDRPSLSRLLKNIRRYTTAGRLLDRANGLRDLPKEEGAWDDFILEIDDTVWHLGKSLSNIQKRLWVDMNFPSPPPPCKKRSNSESNDDDLGGPAGAELGSPTEGVGEGEDVEGKFSDPKNSAKRKPPKKVGRKARKRVRRRESESPPRDP